MELYGHRSVTSPRKLEFDWRPALTLVFELKCKRFQKADKPASLSRWMELTWCHNNLTRDSAHILPLIAIVQTLPPEPRCADHSMSDYIRMENEPLTEVLSQCESPHVRRQAPNTFQVVLVQPHRYLHPRKSGSLPTVSCPVPTHQSVVNTSTPSHFFTLRSLNTAPSAATQLQWALSSTLVLFLLWS